MVTIAILLCIVLFIISRFGIKLLGELQKALDEDSERESDYRNRTLRALERMSSAVPEEEGVVERSTLDSFLEGNRKILEKSQIRHAMKDELGID